MFDLNETCAVIVKAPSGETFSIHPAPEEFCNIFRSTLDAEAPEVQHRLARLSDFAPVSAWEKVPTTALQALFE